MLPELGTIATQHSAPTENTMHKVHKFLDYAATHPNAIITYRASNMILAAHIDSSYLSESKTRGREGGHFSCPTTQPSRQTMYPSSPFHKSSRKSCRQQRKQSWEPFSSTVEKQSQHTMHWKLWVTNSRPPQYKLITPLHLELSPTTLQANDSNQWT